ncbi:MAG: carbamoyltransferase [Acidobacteriota bacterium]|nr:MAG: carbamoyltransferase [Acidobacteriota bacterium]
MTRILGISAYYHDSAACLLEDGRPVAALQEERFSRTKHDSQFPRQAIDACLDIAGCQIEDLDYVVFYEKPFSKFERLLETYLDHSPAGLRSYLKAMPLWLKDKLWIKDKLRRSLEFSGPLLFGDHHESHAASAFYPSPFKSAAIYTVDGVGEWTTTSLGRGEDNRIELNQEIRFPHSLGLLYSSFTYYLGFKVNSGEYKLMGLAPYGSPVYADQIRDELINIQDDGAFELNPSYFNYEVGLEMASQQFCELFGGPPRKPSEPLTTKQKDIAASIQKVTEEVVLRTARHLHRETGEVNLCMAGGVALNCVANGRVIRETPFERIWVQPASGDAGGSLGAALAVWHRYLENPRPLEDNVCDFQAGSLLGTEYSESAIEDFLKEASAVFTKPPEKELLAETAECLSQGGVVGWYQGRMEFGPRALGNRSILADARQPHMLDSVNLRIKYRESFRPFAPAVLEEDMSEYFELSHPSPYMLLVAQVRADQRGRIPAVTHVDGSARIQTVDRERNPRFHALLAAFKARTGCSVVLNTSFNVRGEPIVESPAQAYRCFMRTGMDLLVLGPFVLRKAEQPTGL